MSDTPIDQATLRRLFEITGGDPVFVDELMDTYLEDGSAQLKAMREAQASGDAAGLVRPAHTLKSSSLSIGALGLAELCRTLEADARSGTVPDARARVETIATTLEAVRQVLLLERTGR